MSKNGTSSITALNKSGLMFKHAWATRVPPALAPLALKRLGWVILLAIMYSAQLMKSRNELRFFNSLPSSCH